MSTIPSGYQKLAVVGIAYKGDYDSTQTYSKLNAVYYNGSTYVALIDNPVGTPSNDGSNWKYLSKGFTSQTLNAFTSLDTEGLLGTVGATVNAQDLVDKIAEILESKEDAITKNTAFNKNFETQASNYAMDGVASVGTSNNVARADHVHPSDTTKLNTNGDASSTTVTFTSADTTTEPTYTSIDVITSGETQASLMTKVSQMAQNQRAINTKASAVNYSNENLLDNGWFTVNQRGFTSDTFTAIGYTVDRWFANPNLVVTANSDNTITLNGSNWFSQRVGNDELFGKTVTLSVLLNDGTILYGTGTLPIGSENWKYVALKSFDECILMLQNMMNCYGIGIQKKNTGNDITIKAVKLELGSVSTLANDVAPNYDEELYKCSISTADSGDTYANQPTYGDMIAQNLLNTINYVWQTKEDTLTVINNADGSLTFNGTTTKNNSIKYTLQFKKGTYTISGCPKTGSNTTYRMTVTDGTTALAYDFGYGATFTLNSDTTIYVYIDIRSSYSPSNLTFYPMLEKGTVAHSYKPYKESYVTNGNVKSLTDTTVNMLSPTLESTVQSGITVVKNSDNSYTLNGKNETGSRLDITFEYQTTYKQGTYKLVGMPKSGTTGDTCLLAMIFNGDTWVRDYIDYGDGIVFTSNNNRIAVVFVLQVGAEVTNAVIKPMITTNLNATYDDYVPYTGDTGKLNSDVAELKSDVDIIGKLYLGTKNSGVTCANAGAETVIGSITLTKGTWLINCGGYNPLNFTSGNSATNISLRGYWGSMAPIDRHTFNMSVVIELTATKTLELTVVNWENEAKTSITNYDFTATRLK